MRFASRRLTVLVLLFGLLTPSTSLFNRTVSANARADQPVIARVTLKTREELERFVRLGLDMLETREGDDRFILTTEAQIEWLREQGWTVTVDDRQTAALSSSSAPGTKIFMGGYRTVAEARAFLDQQAALYPNLAEVFVYGSSWERVTSGGAAGHDLFGIRLTNKQRPGPKPKFFLMASIHAREIATTEIALRFVDYLLSGYGTNGDITWLLDEHEIVIVPVVNPDGRVIAEQGYYQRKNTNYTYGGNCQNPPTPFDQIGVDLNRNSSFKWGMVNTPTEPKCGQTYPGPSPASEPETAALENLVRSLFPDQRGPLDTDAAPLTTTGVLITLHSYGNLVLWPWGHTGTPAPNGAGLALIGHKFASYNGFAPDQSTGLYPASGTTDDWAYGELGIPAYTFEVGPN
ncbi:MAG TPA: M14 family zinc carboxypeptidase, partial [Pyrinomonadaceae bacterium]|nr:M14 family zinc carboxypeptidase [Pyrinomonadaceae bacterium]